MITRYSRPEMRAIWTDENKLRIWLRIELLASEALVRQGVVPAKVELPAGKGTQVTALNFSASTVDEMILLPGVASGPVVDMLAESVVGDLDEFGTLRISLDGYCGVSLRIVSALPAAIVDEDD